MKRSQALLKMVNVNGNLTGNCSTALYSTSHIHTQMTEAVMQGAMVWGLVKLQGLVK